MNRLEGKSVVITGAATGIGEAIAEACHAEGAGLVLVDLDPAVEAVAVRCGGSDAIVGDITDDGLAERAVAAAIGAFGSVTGLVNNAAIVPPRQKLQDLDDSVWDRTLAVNTTAPMRWSRAFVREAVKTGGGSIVNIASIESNFVGPGGGTYHVTKAGLLGLTRVVAVEYGRLGIRANAISPGSIRTQLFERVMGENPGLEETVEGLNFAGRVGDPSEVAAIAVMLLSDEAPYCNGSDFVIDGGRLVATLGPEGL